MKKLILLSGAALLAVAFSASANTTYTDVQTINTTIGLIQNNPYIGFFDIVNPGSETINPSGGPFTDKGGYVLGSAIDSAEATFWISDHDHAPEVVAIQLGLILDSVNFESGSWNLTFDASGGPLDIFFLETGGKLGYAIGSLGGNFTLENAMLTVNAEDPAGTAVPDGASTATLLGSAVLGLGAISRRLRAA